MTAACGRYIMFYENIKLKFKTYKERTNMSIFTK